MPPSYLLRAGPSGPPIVGTPGDVLTIDAGGDTVSPQPPSGGGGGVPLSRALWVDATSTATGTQDGSDEQPFKTITAACLALAELTAGIRGAALLVLPGDYSLESPVPLPPFPVLFDGIGGIDQIFLPVLSATADRVFLRNVNASDIHDESEFGCTVYLLCANAATVFGGAELATNVVGFGVGNVVNGISDIGVLTGLSAVQGLYLNSFTFGGSGSIAVQVLRAYDSTIEGGFICSASANLRGCVYSGDLSGTGSGTTGSFDDCEFGPGTMSAFAPSDASQVPFRNCTFSGFNIHNDDNTTAVDAVSLRNLAALNVIAQNTVTCNLQSLDSGEMAMLAPFADADQTVDFSAETRIVCFQNTLTANRTLTVLGDSGQDKQLFCVDFYGSSPGGFDLIIQDGGIPTTLATLTNAGGCVRAWIQIQGENMALFSLEQINPTL